MRYRQKKILLFSITLLLISAVCYPSIQSVKLDHNKSQRVTLISKSTGLDSPEKEEGKTELEIADMNNDGHVDIISVGDHGSPYINSGQHGIMVWLGDGTGIWSVHQDGNFGYGGCGVGDINLDGYMDVTWGIHHDYGSTGYGDTLIGAALGDGSGSNWTPWATGLGTNGETWGMFATDLADFNCDGYLDIVSQSFGCCNGLHVYENHGNGTWSPRWSLTGGNVKYTLETCDINADGHMDFVSTKDGSIAFFNTNGSFNFQNKDTGLPVSDITSIDAGDINNDGRDDIVVGLYSNGVRCYMYDINNDTWESLSNGLPTTNSYYLTQFGDIDGDGNLDIIFYNGPTGYVYLGDGTGNWASDATFTMPSPGDYSAMRVDGDIDHDGREDIAIQAEQSDFPTAENQLRVYSPWQEPTSLTSIIKTPNGGEHFKAGSIRDIKWLSSIPLSHNQANVDIQISTSGPSGPWNTIATDIPNNGRYQWSVSNSVSSNCRIKIIISTDQGSCECISTDDFTISQGSSVNTPPEIPDRPQGPTQGESFIYYPFTTVAMDPDGDMIRYGWDWDADSIIDQWTDYNSSGLPVTCTHRWGQKGIYSIKVIAEDEQGLQSSFSPIWSIMIDLNETDIPFFPAWNLIAIYWENNWSASNLSAHLYSCQSISRWDALNQTYQTYIVGGPPSFDFSLKDGHGYFVNMQNSDVLEKNGLYIDTVNVSLELGWNLIGWYHDENTTASSLSENITACNSISTWNATMQTYDTYITNGPPSFDFLVQKGMGLFVDVSQSSTWNGEG